jgi:hypothetical protein
MITHPARRIEVLADTPLLRRICAAADAAGVTNYTLLETAGGRGAHGPWRHEDVTGATDKTLFITVASPEKAEALVAALEPLLDSHDLMLTITETSVVRREIL